MPLKHIAAWPCLFCDSAWPHLVIDPAAPSERFALRWVECADCGARGPIEETDDMAFKMWNRIWKKVFGKPFVKKLLADQRSGQSSVSIPTSLVTTSS